MVQGTAHAEPIRGSIMCHSCDMQNFGAHVNVGQNLLSGQEHLYFRRDGFEMLRVWR
jgi:hypothetical protein